MPGSSPLFQRRGLVTESGTAPSPSHLQWLPFQMPTVVMDSCRWEERSFVIMAAESLFVVALEVCLLKPAL